MQPIFEQIVNQIKATIMQGTIKENQMLPSVRSLAKELRVSALTVKKAYDALEDQGFIVTVHGKGSFVSCANQELMLEEKRKEVEDLCRHKSRPTRQERRYRQLRSDRAPPRADASAIPRENKDLRYKTDPRG